MLSTALTLARTRAIQTGRPVGVMFEPFDAAGNTAAVLHYVQVAAPMSGVVVDPVEISVEIAPGVYDQMWRFDYAANPDNATFEKYARISWPKPGAGCGGYDDDDDTCFVYGGRLKLNYQGHEYPVYEVTTAGPPESPTYVSADGETITMDPDPSSLSSVPVPTGPQFDFQFYPPPKKSSLFPLQLPTRAVVDIGASGVGSSGQFSPGSGTPVMVTFTPTGEVDRIYHGDAPAGEELDEPLYLLVGKPGKTQYDQDESDYSSDPDPESTAREVNNLLDGENIWIKVDPRTGAVSSAENNPAIDVTNLEQALKDARTWAEGN